MLEVLTDTGVNQAITETDHQTANNLRINLAVDMDGLIRREAFQQFAELLTGSIRKFNSRNNGSFTNFVLLVVLVNKLFDYLLQVCFAAFLYNNFNE